MRNSCRFLCCFSLCRCVFNRDLWRAYSIVNTHFAQQTFESLTAAVRENPKIQNPLIWVRWFE